MAEWTHQQAVTFAREAVVDWGDRACAERDSAREHGVGIFDRERDGAGAATSWGDEPDRRHFIDNNDDGVTDSHFAVNHTSVLRLEHDADVRIKCLTVEFVRGLDAFDRKPCRGGVCTWTKRIWVRHHGC
jgi:hypothetical protein